MIAIINIGPYDDPDIDGIRNYRVCINGKTICEYEHKRSDGLAVCLAKASEAVKKQHIRNIREGVKTPFSEISSDGLESLRKDTSIVENAVKHLSKEENEQEIL